MALWLQNIESTQHIGRYTPWPNYETNLFGGITVFLKCCHMTFLDYQNSSRMFWWNMTRLVIINSGVNYTIKVRIRNLYEVAIHSWHWCNTFTGSWTESVKKYKRQINLPVYNWGWLKCGAHPDNQGQVVHPGSRLNIKTVLSTYGDFHVKDKTAVRTSYL